MKTSEAGLRLIKDFEDLRLDAYYCQSGVLTVGYGHTGEDVFEGQCITPDKADQLLADDVARCEKYIKAYVRVPLTQGQYDALVSFIFNCGSTAFHGSTLLVRLNEGDYKAAAKEILRWNKGTVRGQKVVLPGLVRRREAEKEMFESKTALAALDKDGGGGCLKNY